MSKVNRFEDLKCWQAARELVNLVYELSEQGKFKKDWDTKSQYRRAALSVMNNIAEGFMRYSNNEFIRFLNFAQSSAGEVKSMTYILEDQNYLPFEDIKKLHEKADKAINLTLGMIRYLKSKNK